MTESDRDSGYALGGPANDQRPEKPPVRLWPYAVVGSFLLVVFVAGVLAPDYFNYKICMAKLAVAQKSAAVGSNVASTLTFPVGGAGASNPAPAQTHAVISQEGAGLAALELNASDIFETYGKLLTMLIAFVSVLGVFFGYFVRRSLREVEEDLRSHVALSMDLWAREKDRLSGEVASKLEEINKQQHHQATLISEFQNTVDQSKKALEALEAAAKSEETKLTGGNGRTARAAASIDADQSIPVPEVK